MVVSRAKGRSNLASSSDLAAVRHPRMSEYEPSSRQDPHKVKRYQHRANYDERQIHDILDEGVVAHVTFALPAENGPQDEYATPAIPMAYGRVENTIVSRRLEINTKTGPDQAPTVNTVPARPHHQQTHVCECFHTSPTTASSDFFLGRHWQRMKSSAQ